jgi:molybdate transport system substrate-binding protein
VFAAADESLPAALHREGLVEQPVIFARNRLVVAIPASGGPVKSFADLARPGVKIAAGSPAVPVGAYALRALAGVAPAQRRKIQANVATEEPDGAAVIGRVRSGAVDAGFAYVTDVLAAEGLSSIDLPVEVEVVYAAAVVKGTARPEEARRFVKGLLAGDGRKALERAGFR